MTNAQVFQNEWTQSSDTCSIISYVHSGDTQEAGVWFTFLAKSLCRDSPKVAGASGGTGAQVSGPCQRFLKDLNYAGRLN